MTDNIVIFPCEECKHIERSEKKEISLLSTWLTPVTWQKIEKGHCQEKSENVQSYHFFADGHHS